MPLFLDACALAKRYLHEGESTRRMRQITGRFDRWGGFVVSEFIEPECISAFAKYAREQKNSTLRQHYLTQHPSVVDALRRDLSRAAFALVPFTEDILDHASDLLRTHPEYRIGAGDAVHLATALEILPTIGAPLVFLTADSGLEEAAKAEGLVTMNPRMADIGALEAVPGLDPPGER
jgi:predicted nucleic acid-binding protein